MRELLNNLNFRHIHAAGRTYTPADVIPLIDELAAYLRANNRSGSPFVFLFAPNHIKTVVAYFAILKADLIVVPIDPGIKPLELADLESDCQPCVYIRIDASRTEFDRDAEFDFRPPAVGLPDEDLTDVCMMVYTAAEDGWYKGAMLTRENLLANAAAFVHAEEVRPEDVACALAPLHHTYGLQTGLLGPILAGASVLIEEVADLHGIKTFVDDIRRCGVTNLYTLPAMYYLMSCVRGIRESVTKVRAAGCGGYKLTDRMFGAFREATGIEIREGYGLTEASPICSSFRAGDRILIDSVGRKYDCCEIAILEPAGHPAIAERAEHARAAVHETLAHHHDRTNGTRADPQSMRENRGHSQRLPVGQVGEVCIRGANVMKGYYGHPAATRAALRDGWLRTGDLGRLDADGHLYLTGLAKKMLNVGGKNVYPAEAERLLRRHQDVAHVEILGEDSPVGGHVARARIVLRGSDDEAQELFRKWYRENLSAFKLPKRVEFAND